MHVRWDKKRSARYPNGASEVQHFAGNTIKGLIEPKSDVTNSDWIEKQQDIQYRL